LGDFVWKDTMWTVEMVTFQINLLSIAVLWGYECCLFECWFIVLSCCW